MKPEENINPEEEEGELALWSPDVKIIELEKDKNGLGFSILDYQVCFSVSLNILKPSIFFFLLCCLKMFCDVDYWVIHLALGPRNCVGKSNLFLALKYSVELVLNQPDYWT